MTDILFYHLERQRLEQVLPQFLVKCLERDWRSLVVVPSNERLDALDNHLWTFSDQIFLAHGKQGDGREKDQPVLLSLSDDNSNGANVCFLVDGADTKKLNDFNRVVHLFDGRNEDSIGAARTIWKEIDNEAHDVTYWQQDDSGQWIKSA